MSNQRQKCVQTTPLIGALPREERPRERLLAMGGQALSDIELVAILLEGGGRGLSSIERSHRLLRSVGGLQGLSALRSRSNVPGVGVAMRSRLLATVELSIRLARSRVPRRDLINQPDAVASYLSLRFFRPDQECMGALYVDVRNRLIRERELFRGKLSRLAVEPRGLIKEGLLCDAAGFILFHTHPSGDPSPSTEDLTFTRRVAEAGELVGVTLLDHVILGGGGRWVSLGKKGQW